MRRLTRAGSDPLRSRTVTLGFGALLLASAFLQPGERVRAVVHAAPAVAPRAPGAQRLELVTYNVWGLPDWMTAAPRARFALIRERLLALAPDVVALQEVWTDAARSCVPDGGPWSVVRGDGEWFLPHKSGLVTATRHRVLEAASYHFRAESGPTALVTAKGALRTTIELADGRVGIVWNTHMQAGVDAEPTRRRQALELIGWMEEALERWNADHPDRPAFVTLLGDLNSAPESPAFELLRSWFASHGAGLTSHALPPTYDCTANDWAVAEEPRAIDHGMVAATAVERFRAERLLVDREQRAGGRHLSDHWAARIAFTLR